MIGPLLLLFLSIITFFFPFASISILASCHLLFSLSLLTWTYPNGTFGIWLIFLIVYLRDKKRSKTTTSTERWLLLKLHSGQIDGYCCFCKFFRTTLMVVIRVKKKKSLERKKEKKGYFLIFEIFRISRSFDSPHPLDNFQIESDNLDNETGMTVSFLNYLYIVQWKKYIKQLFNIFWTIHFNV